MELIRNTLRHGLAYLAIIATVLLPSGALVNCVATDGHAMVELVHAAHDGDDSEPSHSMVHAPLVETGCNDTALDGASEFLVRDRLDVVTHLSAAPLPPVLFVLDAIELWSGANLEDPFGVPLLSTPDLLALRVIVLRV